MKHPVVILDESYTTNELLAMIGQLDVLIGIRLHALIFAAVMNVPVVGVSYDPKIERFLQSLGDTAAGTLKTITPDKLMTYIEQAMENRDAYKASLEERMQVLRNNAFRNAELAIELMVKHKRSS